LKILEQNTSQFAIKEASPDRMIRGYPDRLAGGLGTPPATTRFATCGALKYSLTMTGQGGRRRG